MADDTKAIAPAEQGGIASLPVTEGLQRLYGKLRATLLQNYRLFIEQGGEESLHDFRVSLRRLRSLLRNYRQVLEVDAALPEQLRSMQQQTNQARDLEVFVAQLQYLCPEHPGLIPLQQKLQEAYLQLREGLPETWWEIAAALPQPLSFCEEVNRYTTLGELCGHLGGQQLSRLKREFKSLRRNWDEALLHRLRIHGKRIRYLLEPFAATPRVTEALKGLKQMQDQLGEYRDLQLLRLHLEALDNTQQTCELLTLLEPQQRQLAKSARRFTLRSRQQRLLGPLRLAIKGLKTKTGQRKLQHQE